MSSSEVARLANDIAAQFAHRSSADASLATATHMRTFWDPRMRRQLLELVAEGGDDLDPVVVGAAAHLEPPGAG
jgi:formate dehydrogenase subunit delta